MTMRTANGATLVATVPTVLSAVRPLVDAGVAVHWLHRRSKRPMGDDWQKQPVHTIESLTAAYQSGCNVGVRPGEHSLTTAGYLHLIDLDIRKPELADEAWACLLERWPDARNAPFVISGSGGESRHIYFFTDKPFRSLTLGRSSGSTEVFDPTKERMVKKRDWEVELFGAPKQAVLPPSVHPDTGEQYRWGREIDFDLLALGIGPIVDSDTVAAWGADDDLNIDEDDDLLAIVRAEPMGLSEAEISAVLADIPNDDVHHDDYVQVGMALHHEYRGSQVGFDRWCEWAKQSAKFDAKICRTKWKSFKGRSRPVRMATLIKAAGVARLEREHSDLDDLLDMGNLQVQGTALTVIPTVTSLDIDLDDDLADLLGPTSPPITPGAVGLPPVDKEWRSRLQMTEDGKAIKPTLHNVELIVRHDARFRGVVGFNEFTQEIVQRAVPAPFKLKKAGPKPVRQLDSPIWKLRDSINGDLWSDGHDDALRSVIEAPTRQGGYGLRVSDRDLSAAIGLAAKGNGFHPVRDYLQSLRWDGVERVATLFVDYVGADDNAYHREAAVLTVLGAVTRVFEPGHKFDFVPILEGLQGKRKSTFIRILARYWFAELEGDFRDTKSLVERMQGAWILEIPELQGFSKAEVTSIKGFISRTFDKVRLAYARRALEFHRQCVFIGSTNEKEYLRDATGNRRFWPISCSVVEIDTDRLSANVDQVWAEAVALYRQLRSINPTGTLPLYLAHSDARSGSQDAQENRRQVTPEEMLAGQIEEWLNQPVGSELGFCESEPKSEPRNFICAIEIWTEMLGQSSTITPLMSQQIGRALAMLQGWEKTTPRRTSRFGSQRGYRRLIAA